MWQPLLALFTCFVLSVIDTPALADWVRIEEAVMGTRVSAEVWHEDKATAEAGVAAVFDEMRRIDALMSPYKPESELSRINANAAKGAMPIGDELAELIARSFEFSELTGGAFDITFASVGHMYNYREGVKPDEQAIDEALPAINYHHVILDREAGTIRFAREGVKIDLGGIAKGYAVERAIALLRERGIGHAYVSAGGDSRILGDRLGRPWVIGVRHPRQREKIVAKIPLQDEALSTSGDYERYFEEDGVRYHHILDPGTGKSVGEVRSVTILGPDATSTDALSTSVFVLGVEKGITLINRLDGFEAIVVDREGRLHYSSGLEQLR